MLLPLVTSESKQRGFVTDLWAEGGGGEVTALGQKWKKENLP